MTCAASWSFRCETDQLFCLRPLGHGGPHLCYLGTPPPDDARVFWRTEIPPHVTESWRLDALAVARKKTRSG